MKRPANLAVILAAVLLIGAGEKNEEAGADQQMIQATWEYVSALRDGKPYQGPIGVRITFAGDKVRRIIGKKTHEHGYKLYPNEDPKRVSLIRLVNGKTEVSTGIYRLKADTLTWCFNLPGKPIPKTLATKPGDGLTLCVLKRVGEEREPLQRIVPSEDATHFVGAKSGKRIVIWGVNYDHDDEGRLLEDYWEQQWETVVADFREIKALGANVVRIHLQVAKFMKTPQQPHKANLERLGMLVRLAEQTGLYLDVTGLGCYHKQDVPPWYDALEEQARWKVQARFWRAVAEVCKESPAVFCYDLMNEPILPGQKPETEWLAGELAGKFFVQRIALNLAGRTRTEVARDWVGQMTSAIREVDDRHMITVGVIPWALTFKGAKPLFYSPEVGKPLDFVSVHFYPKKGEVEEALDALMVYEIGKPLVIEEMFPLRCSIEELEQFIDGSRKHADGWVSFYWGKTIEENRQKGDLKGAVIAQWLRCFRSRSPYLCGDSKEGKANR